MKKFLLVLMAIIMAFSLIACDDTTDGSSNPSNGVESSDNGSGGSSDNNSGDSDVPGGTDSSNPDGNVPGTDEENPSDKAGLILSQSVITQFAQAASVKIEFVLDLEMAEVEWLEGYGKLDYNTHGIAKYVVTVAKTENGCNLKVDADVQSDYGEGMTPDLQREVLYIVDGVIYEYNEDLDMYLISEIEEIDTTEVQAMINMLLEEANLTEDDVNAILNELGATFLYAFNVVDNKGSISADIKPAVDAVLAYFKGLNLKEDTLRGVINDALALVDENLTVEMLLLQLESVYNMTLEEYITALDGELSANYGMTLQDLYDSFAKNETVQMILKEVWAEEGISETEIESRINAMLQAKVTDLIPKEYMSKTMYEVIVDMLSKAQTDDVPDEVTALSETTESQATLPSTTEEFMVMVNSILDMSLLEAEQTFGIPCTMIVMMANFITVDAYDYEINVNFTGIFQIESVDGEYNFGFTMVSPSEVSGEENMMKVSLNLTFKLYEISRETIEITAPTDKEYFIDIFGKDYEGVFGEYSSTLTLETYEDGTIDLILTLRDEDTVCGYIYCNEITLNDFEEVADGFVITFAQPYTIDENADYVALASFTVGINYELDTFEVVPTQECEHEWGLWQDNGEGGNIRVCVLCGETQEQE